MEDQFIGSYKVLKKIGAGGMARVYLAVHQDVPDLKVILKILSDSRMGERFRQEANKLALLEGHANICRIKHFFNHGDDTVIAMEYIDGFTLEEKINFEGKVPLDESLQIISVVLDILDFAHGKGIYHRDIKPSNIMIDKKGQVKIIDFGIAKAETDPNLTIAGSACGTPAYMAPEQFTPTPDTNYTLVDVYAAGTTLYVMLTGECPFKGDNEFAIRDAKLFSDAPRVSSLNPEVPKKVDEIVTKTLAKEPAERFQSANEMRAALGTVQRERKGGVVPEQAEMTIDLHIRPKKKTKKPLLAALAVVLVAVAALALYYLAINEDKTGTINITVTPHGDIYIDNNLLGTNISTYSFTGKAGRHNIRVINEESIEKESYETVWLEADSVVPVSFKFSFYTHPAFGSINIAVAPKGDIYFDGNLVGKGKTDTIVTSDTGVHIIRVVNNKAVQKEHVDTVILAANDTLPWNYRFTIPSPTPEVDTQPPEQNLGVVRVGSNPRGADVYIDGEFTGYQTHFTFYLEPGRHIIKVRLVSEGEVLEKDITVLVEKGKTEKVSFNLTQ